MRALNGLKQITLSTALTVAVAIGAIQAPSYAGGANGGGGSVVKANRDQIISAVRKLLDRYDQESMPYYLQYVRASLDRVSDPEIKPVLENMIHAGTVETVFADSRLKTIWASQYWFKEHGPCYGTDGAQQASVSKNRPNGRICYSIERLSEVPAVQLQSTILSLTAHEIAHLYGPKKDRAESERIAKKIEEFFANAVPDLVILDKAFWNAIHLQKIARLSLTSLGATGSRLRACMDLVRYEKFLGELSRTSQSLTLEAQIGKTLMDFEDYHYDQGGSATDRLKNAHCADGQSPELSEQERKALENYYERAIPTFGAITHWSPAGLNPPAAVSGQ